MSDAPLCDRVALVLAGARGIGAACARRFAQDGAAVMIADVDATHGMALAAQLPCARFVEADAGDTAAIRSAIARTIDTWGRVDIVHANAGVGASHRVVDMPESEWRRVLDVNLTSAFVVAQEALRSMREQRSGAIVVTSSPHALMTNPATAAYAASKAGLLALVRSLALEGAEFGVRANAVIPGVIDTPMVQDFIGAAQDPRALRSQFAGMSPLRRLGRPEEVAEAVAFLCSDAASFVTGAALAVDGGLMATLAGAIAYD